ncbi:MAG: radical SAM protein [Bacteroidales bacterium]|jgi:MoaA/NifB/PqqE/SkfB family radical SAM enzyme|nr:radical SAM protein [Bacteroidales bacterium]
MHIGGVLKDIPRYPHHKNFVYKLYRYFEVKSLFNFLTIDGLFYIPNRLYLNWKYKAVLPRLLMIDPTSACNLKCKGCWAADYSKNSNLSYEKLDELLTDARKLGVIEILMTGGEPLMRKDDILKLCRKHNRLTFGIFTNGTLIDDAFAAEMERLGNLNVYLSIEGYREDTDMRRGRGTYDKVIAAMDILRKYDLGFGFSVCYHSGNYRTVSSDEFLDFLREKGAWFGWMFTYLPIGKDADVSLCCDAEQRAWVKNKIEDYQRRKKFTIVDFPNSGHKSIGCVAAGNDFAHINANGDLEPCAFCHYSDSNINEMSLLEALRSPFFRNFRKHKPFSDNFLQPCPFMDVPRAIVKITDMEGVKSTHLSQPESPAELAARTAPIAEKWEPVARRLYEEMPEAEKRRFGLLTKLMFWGNGQIAKW